MQLAKSINLNASVVEQCQLRSMVHGQVRQRKMWWHVVAVPGPDACLELLGGRAPSHSHEPPVLQGQPGPALDWLIACAYTGIVVGREIREGGWTPVH